MRIVGAGLLFLLLVLTSVACHGQTLHITTEEYPPYNFRGSDGKTVIGMSADIVRELAKRAGIKVSIVMYPWQRALLLAQKEPHTGVISAIRSPERESNFKWVGPLVSDNLAIFGLADAKIELKSLADVGHYRIGSYNGSVANEYLVANGIQPDIVPVDSLNLKKLQDGRIDLWVASFRTAPIVAKKAGIQIARCYLLGKKFTSAMYLALNRDFSDETVQRLNGILRQMNDDGTLEKIISRY